MMSDKKNLPEPQPNLMNVLGKPYHYDWAVDGARQALAEHNRSGIALGLYIKAIKDNEEHGNYTKALDKIGINIQSAMRYRKRAVFVLENMDKFKINNLLNLNGAKLDQLIHLPETVLSEIVDDDGMIAGCFPKMIDGMTANEFAEVLKPYKAATETAIAELDQTKKDLLDTRIRLSNAKFEIDEIRRKPEPTTRLPLTVATFRQESAVITLAADSHLDALSHMIEALKDPLQNKFPSDNYDEHRGDCARAINQQIKTLYAKSTSLMRQFHVLFPNDKIEKPSDIPYFDDNEAQSIHTDLRVMLGRAKIEADDREHMRQARQPKRRGRPSGSKNNKNKKA